MVKIADATTNAANSDPLLSLVGSGKDLWATEPADDYVQRLREGWQEPITGTEAGRST
jgi:hypothetical protein